MSKSLVFILVLLHFMSISRVFSTANKRPLSDLKFFGGALNIEGGEISRNTATKPQKWANFGFVLDTPFSKETPINHQILTNNNHFKLKEASLNNFNELKSNALVFAILNYYIEESPHLFNKKIINITFQIHRNSSGERYLKEIISPYLKYKSKDWKVKETENNSKNSPSFMIEKYNVKIKFITNYQFIETENYKDQDIVISLSLFAGINPDYKSSDIIIPSYFIPLKLDTLTLNIDDQYYADNDLLIHYPKILKKINHELIQYVRKHANSENMDKKQTIDPKDFKYYSPVILQADRIFIPSLLPDYFTIKKNDLFSYSEFYY